MYYAYVIKNQQGILFKGSAEDLGKRISQHNSNNNFSSFTLKRGPWELIYSKKFNTRKEAEKKELYFKSGTGRRFLKQKVK